MLDAEHNREGKFIDSFGLRESHGGNGCGSRTREASVSHNLKYGTKTSPVLKCSEVLANFGDVAEIEAQKSRLTRGKAGRWNTSECFRTLGTLQTLQGAFSQLTYP